MEVIWFVFFCTVLVEFGFELQIIVCLLCVPIFVTVVVCALLSMLILYMIFVLHYFSLASHCDSWLAFHFECLRCLC